MLASRRLRCSRGTKVTAAVPLICLTLLVPATASGTTPKPRTGKSVVVSLAKGTVFVKKRGSSKRARLGRAARSIPTGSVVDATRGTVRLTSTRNRRGTRRQTAAFYDGAFRVTQTRSARPVTDLTLVGGDFSTCTGASAKPGVFGVRAARRARRRLWGRGRGRFRTRGRRASATVRGTTWRTTDSCAGTETFNKTGRVQTSANDVDLSRLLEPGQSIIYHCNLSGPPAAPLYCVLVLSQPAGTEDNPDFDLVGFGIATARSPYDTYRLCVKAAGLADDCGEFPMYPPNADGIRAAGVGCVIGQPNNYTAVWSIAGTELPLPLPFTTKTPYAQSFCVSDPRRPGEEQIPRTALRQARAAARNGD